MDISEKIDLDELMQQASGLAMDYIPQLLLALLTLILGFWIIGRIVKGTKKIMAVRQIEETLQNFLSNSIGVVFKILLLVSVAGMVGIETTSFIAMLGAMGLAIGMAFSGTLSNFAGGVMVLIFKPFKTGDLIELPESEYLHCDGPTPIMEYRFPNQKFGNKNQILLTKSILNDKYEVESIEIQKTYLWNGKTFELEK